MGAKDISNIPDKIWLHDRYLAAKDDPAAGVGKFTVFLVEDDSDDRRQAFQELIKSPYIQNVHCFESGDKMIEHFIAEGYYSGNLIRYLPTLIVLDIHIPGNNGIEILRELKNHPLTDNIPVIILTGDTSDELELEAYKFKANAFVTKPLDLKQVHKIIGADKNIPS
jgi:CheY-like chemotaxis protein